MKVPLTVGAIILYEGILYKVETLSKDQEGSAKGEQKLLAILKDLASGEILKEVFKETQLFQEAPLETRPLEFLYEQEGAALFLDDDLEIVKVPLEVVGELLSFLKTGGKIDALVYNERVFSLELPPFLELVVKSDELRREGREKIAILETGASIEIPSFVCAGDTIKIDTRTKEFVQRV